MNIPLAPHPKSLMNPDLSLETARFKLIWCPRHRVGAAFDKASEKWATYSPVTHDEFLEQLLAQKIITTREGAAWALRVRPHVPFVKDSIYV